MKKATQPRPMKGRNATRRRGAGVAADGRKHPTPGWKGPGPSAIGWRNPRPPAVPATLDLTLDEYFTAATLMGLVASQIEEPNQQWCRDWSFTMGAAMAREAYRRRRRKAKN
jgi:hypothetical protein